jgi:fatty acid desaturase
MSKLQAPSAGTEFREDHRVPGAGNAQARKILSAEELKSLTTLHSGKALLSIGLTMGLLALLMGTGAWAWQHSMWWLVLMCMLAIGVQQHALFILNHEAAHNRLLPNRWWNDAIGSFIGMTGGVSMHTYRVTHRLHHNHLYGVQDPDTAIHGGYPRGKAYLLKKLAQDVVGWNAWKTYLYFFGSPAINSETGQSINPLNDTSEALRAAARRDRMRVVGFQLLMLATLILIAINAHSLLGYLGFFTPSSGAVLLHAQNAAWYYLVLWVLPLITVLQPILRLRAICEHGGVTDLSSPLTAARCVKTWGSPLNLLGRALLFPHHVNHHLEHHLYPAVPHYHLRRLHELLQQKGALQGAEVRDLSEVLQTIFAPRKAKNLEKAIA